MDQSFNDRLKDIRANRFEYVFKQTKMFSHFVANGLTLSDKNAPANAKQVRKRKLKEFDIDSIENDSKKTKLVFRFDATPDFINGEMRDYQIAGLNWMINLMENGVNGILADEMGLGKTLQTIALLGYMKTRKNVKNPHLVVAPKSTLANWMNEINRWCPSLKAVCLIGNAEERKEIIKTQMNRKHFDVCVTTYQMITIERGRLNKFGWNYLVVDEAHAIKNEQTQLATNLRIFATQNRLLLTGTPLQNNLHELWSLLNFLLPEIFDSSKDFDSWFDSQECLNNESLVSRLHEILKPFLLRRLKSEVEKGLPPKTETKVFVDPSPMQIDWYAKILKREIDVIIGGKATTTRLQNIMMQLRKCANHPYLFSGAEPGPPFTTDAHLLENCGKLAELDRMLMQFKTEGHRVLLFSQMVRMIDILEDYCVWRKFKFCRLDGQTGTMEERQAGIDEFNAEGSDVFIYLISTRAGGQGINLATADTVIMYDSDWNPQMDLQAIDRAHRIGQTKPVNVYRMLTRNTIEEKIVERAEKKLKLDNAVIHKGRNLLSDEVRLGKSDLQSMIEHGAEEMIRAAEARQPKIVPPMKQRGRPRKA